MPCSARARRLQSWKAFLALISGATICTEPFFGVQGHGFAQSPARSASSPGSRISDSAACRAWQQSRRRKVVDLRDRGDRRSATTTRDALLNGDRRWHACDAHPHPASPSARQRCVHTPTSSLRKPPLAFGKNEIKREAGFARTAQARDHHELDRVGWPTLIFLRLCSRAPVSANAVPVPGSWFLVVARILGWLFPQNILLVSALRT